MQVEVHPFLVPVRVECVLPMDADDGVSRQGQRGKRGNRPHELLLAGRKRVVDFLGEPDMPAFDVRAHVGCDGGEDRVQDGAAFLGHERRRGVGRLCEAPAGPDGIEGRGRIARPSEDRVRHGNFFEGRDLGKFLLNGGEGDGRIPDAV